MSVVAQTVLGCPKYSHDVPSYVAQNTTLVSYKPMQPCIASITNYNSCVHVPWDYLGHPRTVCGTTGHHSGTQCVVQRSVLTVDSQHERACHALFGSHVQRAIARFSSIQSGLGLIQIGSGLGECAFSVNTLKPDSIRFNAHWVSSVNRP